MEDTYDFTRLEEDLRDTAKSIAPLQFTKDLLAEERIMTGTPATVPSNVISDEINIQSKSGNLNIHTFKNEKSKERNAALIWFHGGGYTYGSARDSSSVIIAQHCENLLVLSVEYRLAPESPFPAAVDDGYTALEYIFNHHKSLNIDPNKISVGGYSAGGGLAAGVALMTRDKGVYKLSMQLLLGPMLDNLHDTLSGKSEVYPIVTRTISLRAWKLYLNENSDSNTSPYAAPSRAQDLRDLPPTYIGVGTEELFRDEAIDYGRRLMQDGVQCELYAASGFFHAADLFQGDATVCKRFTLSYIQFIKDFVGIYGGSET